MDTIRIGLAFIGALVGTLALIGIVGEVMSMSDPCRTWGEGDGGTLTMRPGDACTSRSSGSETRGHALARLALVNGTLLFAAVLMCATIRWPSTPIALAAGLFMVLLSIPLMIGAFAPLTIWAAAACTIGARHFAKNPGELGATRGLGIVLGLAGLFLSYWVATSFMAGNIAAVVYQLFMAIPLIGAAAIALRPGHRDPARPSLATTP